VSGDRPPARRALKVIPISAGTARPTGRDREQLREAVVQVIHHLVIKAVPAASRSPYFDVARGVLDEAGWGLDELLTAAVPGPDRDTLFGLLGLAGDEPRGVDR
jgi:hypothetical protein